MILFCINEIKQFSSIKVFFFFLQPSWNKALSIYFMSKNCLSKKKSYLQIKSLPQGLGQPCNSDVLLQLLQIYLNFLALILIQLWQNRIRQCDSFNALLAQTKLPSFQLYSQQFSVPQLFPKYNGGSRCYKVSAGCASSIYCDKIHKTFLQIT